MGELRIRQNRNADALPFLQFAVRADPENPDAHFYYAQVLETLSSEQTEQERHNDLEWSRSELLKTTRLAPWFADPYLWLGYVGMALQDRYADTEAVLTAAIDRFPGRSDLRHSLDDVRLSEKAHLAAEQAQREHDMAAFRAAARFAFALPPSPVVVADITHPPAAPAPKPRVVYPTFKGLLTMIDCTEGITLVVHSGDRVVRFKTKTPLHLEFISKTSNAANEAACGPVHTPPQVVVTYRPKAKSGFMGEPIRIEYR
jgi:hypothetical protein